MKVRNLQNINKKDQNEAILRTFEQPYLPEQSAEQRYPHCNGPNQSQSDQ